MEDDTCFTLSGASAQDRAILMCIKRIEELEAKVDDAARIHLADTLTSCTSTHEIALDVFFYLIGIPIALRKELTSNEIVQSHIEKYLTPERIQSDPRIMRICDMVHSSKKFTYITSKDVAELPAYLNVSDVIRGSNMYSYFLTWTYQELKDYWHYRLQWTRWID